MAIPRNPTGFKALYRADQDAIVVTWVAGAGAQQTKLQRWVAAFQLYSDLATVPASQTTYIDTSLTDGEQYAYRGLSINADGNPATYSPPSNKVWAIAAPQPVTGVTAERNSNDSVGVNWANHPTTLAPYDYHYVKRSSNVRTAFTQINRISGNLAYYLDSATEPDRRYSYRVWTSNLIAGGAYYESAASGVVYTTPKAPSNIRARWVGTDILVEWDDLSLISNSFVLEHTTDGSTWDPMGTLGKVKAWRHSDPERGIRHRYRIRSRSPEPSLGSRALSGWVMSGWVEAQTTPNPPTLFGPAFVPAGESFQLEYIHNPLSPESPEAGVQHQRRVAGGTWGATTAGGVVTALASGVMEVRAATRVAGSGWSEWSDPIAIQIRSRPSPNLTSPASGATITGPLLPLGWTLSTQTEWEAELLQGSTLVESLSGTTQRTATATVEDDSSYTLRFRAFDGYLWSNWVTRNFSTAFVVPDRAGLLATVNRDTFSVRLLVVPNGSVARYEFVRRRAGGVGGWERVGDARVGTLTDLLPPLCTDLEYAVVSWSSTGASSTSEPVPVRIDHAAVVLNYGPGLGAVAWMDLGLVPPAEVLQQEQTLHAFARRRRPVKILGSSGTRQVPATGRVVGERGSARHVWEQMLGSDDIWYRDPVGRSFLAAVQSVSLTADRDSMVVSFTAEEVEA